MHTNYKSVVLSISLFFALSVSISAAPGDLDPTFGSGGKLTTAFISREIAQAVAVQPDGKIVAAGYAANALYNDFAVFRYNADGSLDTSFDGDGKLTTDFANGFDAAYAVAIQADGKIIAAGSSDGNFALVRYNPDGSLDNSFGVGGKVITESVGAWISDIAIQTDGKIVAAGMVFRIARYNADGSLDPSFGTGGIAWAIFDQGQSAFSVAVQADGKIVVAGESGGCSDIDNICWSYFSIARFNANGSLDTSFDTDGKVKDPIRRI